MHPFLIPPGAPDAQTLADTAAGAHRRAEAAIAYLNGFGINLDADTKRYLRAPVLRATSDWAESVPGWMYRQARSERFGMVLGTIPGIVGPSEIAVILFAASLTAPLQHAYAELYFWAAAHPMKRHGMQELSHTWRAIGADNLSDGDVLEPRGRLNDVYTRFAHDIRAKLVNLKSATNHTKRRADVPGSAGPATAPADANTAPSTQGELAL